MYILIYQQRGVKCVKICKQYGGCLRILSIVRKSDAIDVDYIIRPSKSYPGGNYGSYGGYDVILLKLKKKVA